MGEMIEQGNLHARALASRRDYMRPRTGIHFPRSFHPWSSRPFIRPCADSARAGSHRPFYHYVLCRVMGGSMTGREACASDRPAETWVGYGSGRDVRLGLEHQA